MTQGKNSSLTQLVEVFPSWTQEDLQAVLNDAGGDVYVAISRISEGHVSQWSDSTKKVAPITSSTFETRTSRTDRNDRTQRRENSNYSNKTENKFDSSRGQRQFREQRDRPQPSGNRNPAPAKIAPPAPKINTTKSNNVTEDLSWGDSTETASFERPMASLTSAAVADRAVTAPMTSFADAAASALAEKPKKEVVTASIKVMESELPNETQNETFESQIPDNIAVEDVPGSIAIVEVIVPEVEAIPVAEPEIVESCVTEAEIFEEEEIVSMPARATPSLTMEQPAVVLPIRTNLRSNLTVRFGYDASEDVVVPTNTSADKVPVEEAQPTKTPITVSALESTFAMLSASPVPPAKSPEPILSQPVPEVSAWETSRNSGFGTGSSANTASTGYGNFARGRQHGGWDYEPTNPASTANPTNATQGSFGPAPGFSGPTSPAAPQRFVSRAAAQYEHANVYNSSNSPAGNNVNNSRFSPYEETNAAGNNVSQYYTTRTAPQASSGGYPVYRGGNSFNSSRYSSSSRPYYQQHHSAAHNHHQQSPVSQQQSPTTGHFTPYNPHQNYLNNYHHGYPEYSQHADQYGHQQHQQPQQPYYQPYQPPNQYLSNSNMHHHSHHQNQHHNA